MYFILDCISPLLLRKAIVYTCRSRFNIKFITLQKYGTLIIRQVLQSVAEKAV